LSGGKFEKVSPELRTNLLDFYSDLSLPIATKTNQSDWQGVLTALEQLKSTTPVATSAHTAAE
jgi:hypothetical protein